MHVLKCGIGDYGSVRGEAEREEGFHSKVGTISPELTPQNYRLIDREPPRSIDEYIKSLGVKRKIRLDAVRCASIIVDYPKDETKPPREFFEDAKRGLQEYFGIKESAVLWANVHVDEGHPHMHFAFVPLTEREKTYKDGHTEMQVKLSAFDVLTKESLLELHPFMQQYMNERGYEGTLHYADGEKRDKEFMEHKLEQMAKEELERQKNIDELKKREENLQKSIDKKTRTLADTSQKLSNAREELQTVLGDIETLKEQKTDLRANIRHSQNINAIQPHVQKLTGKLYYTPEQVEPLKAEAKAGYIAQSQLKALQSQYKDLEESYNEEKKSQQDYLPERLREREKLNLYERFFAAHPKIKELFDKFLEGKGKEISPKKKISPEEL